MRWSGSGAETAASSKRLNDGGRDKAECGPDQQIHHAAVCPPCQRRRLTRGMEQKGPIRARAQGVTQRRIDRRF